MFEQLRHQHIRNEARLVSDLVATIHEIKSFALEETLSTMLYDIFALSQPLSSISYSTLNTMLVKARVDFTNGELSAESFIYALENILRCYKNAKINIFLQPAPPVAIEGDQEKINSSPKLARG